MAKQTGSRPRPTVARDHTPSFNTDNTGRASGTSSVGAPTGRRPVPTVAKNSLPSVSKPGPTRKAQKRFKMPSPKMRWGTRGGGKPNGGN